MHGGVGGTDVEMIQKGLARRGGPVAFLPFGILVCIEQRRLPAAARHV